CARIEGGEVSGVGATVFVGDVDKTEVVAVAVEREVKAVRFEIIYGLKHLALRFIVAVVQIILISEVPSYSEYDNGADANEEPGILFDPIFSDLQFFCKRLRTFQDFLL